MNRIGTLLILLVTLTCSSTKTADHNKQDKGSDIAGKFRGISSIDLNVKTGVMTVLMSAEQTPHPIPGDILREDAHKVSYVREVKKHPSGALEVTIACANQVIKEQGTRKFIYY